MTDGRISGIRLMDYAIHTGRIEPQVNAQGHLLVQVLDHGFQDAATMMFAPIPCQVFDPRLMTNLPRGTDLASLEAFVAALVAAATPGYLPAMEAVAALVRAQMPRGEGYTGFEPGIETVSRTTAGNAPTS